MRGLRAEGGAASFLDANLEAGPHGNTLQVSLKSRDRTFPNEQLPSQQH